MRRLLGRTSTIIAIAAATTTFLRAAEIAPFTQFLDTQTRSRSPWSGRIAADHTGWKPLAEEILQYDFRGDFAMANDRITVVARAGASRVELYGRDVSIAGPCAELGVLRGDTDSPTAIRNCRITENSLSTIAAELDFAFASGDGGTLQLRLTTGQPILESRIVKGTDRIEVISKPRFIVAPAFFGSDDVFGPSTTWTAEIPADNQLLQFGSEDLMIMSVSNRPFRSVRFATTPGSPGNPAGCSMALKPGVSLWTAILQGRRMWHAVSVGKSTADVKMTLDWKPPFEAKWRADLTRADGYSRSWYFGSSEQASKAESEGQTGCPCRVEGGQAVVQFSSPLLASRDADSALLLYPMDRSRATPLTAVLPIDVLRNTLGVGPCQYLLQSEGLATDSDPTPAAVMDGIERLFSRKRDRQAANEINERLDEMLKHLGNARQRIEQHRETEKRLRAAFESCAATAPATAAEPIRRELDRLQALLADNTAASAAADDGAGLASQVRGLIGKPDSIEQVRRLGANLRLIGERQDAARSGALQLYRRLHALTNQAGIAGQDRWAPLTRELSPLLEQSLENNRPK
jgi:hypothetical protein